MFKMYKQACKLSNVKRFAALKLDREYSGAEHSFRVAIMGMLIADEYNALPGVKEPVSVEEVLRKALIHDLEESVIGDIPTPVKQFPGLRDLLRKASEVIMREQVVDADLPKAEEYVRLWVEDKEGLSGEVIQIADKLEALLAAAYELKRGNRDLQKAFNNVREWFETTEAQKLMDKFPMTRKLLEAADEMPQVKESFKLVG